MKRQTIFFLFTLIIGIFLGWVFFHSSSPREDNHDHASEDSKTKTWTCAMHPQIRMEQRGKCPICGMELIPLNPNTSSVIDLAAIYLTKEATQLANVQTTIVTRQNPEKEVRLYGKVQADERLLQNQVAFISGRVEKLLVNFTGEPVRKGQSLALIYSPELITAQQELLESSKSKQSQPGIYEAAREKLRLWKLSESQISEIENSGNIKTNIEVVSTTSGIVTVRRVNSGDYVSQGSVLYEVSDLSTVWILFDAYESDLTFLNTGDKVAFSVQALPGASFNGTIKFIDPVIDPVNRVAKIRLEIGNPAGKLKPEMFVTGIVKGNPDQYHDKLVVPRSAVLWTGKRSVVYLKLPGIETPVFKMHEIELGPLLGNSYVVSSGLSEGDEVVTQGAFSVDAAAQLEGKPSMMNQKEIPGISEFTPDNKAEAKSSFIHHSIIKDQFKVSGNCDMCKGRIEAAAKSVAGVVSAEWNIKSKLLQIQFEETKTKIDIIEKKVADAGHDTEKFKASDEAYKQLPACCCYRK